MIDFTMPGHRFRRRGSKVGSKFALEPQQSADCDENKLRLVRAPGEGYSNVILGLASDAKPREARWLSGPVRCPFSAPNV